MNGSDNYGRGNLYLSCRENYQDWKGKQKMKRSREALLIVAALSFMMSIAVFQPIALCNNEDEWKAPESDSNKENPIALDANSVAAGKTLYAKNCFSCHGAAGKGDGPVSGNLVETCGDLSDPNMWKQTDGDLFWKITTGKTPMPFYEKRLTEEQRWMVINYIRTLAQNPGQAKK